MSISNDEVINYLSNLSVIDLVNLTKALEDKWGVKAAPVAVAAAAPGPGATTGAPAAEEKT
ncbi:MAG: 50S ribosomal protein L7/L12, partial [Kofleriaceae bacterium]